MTLSVPSRTIALVLSGGVALGAYEAGVFAALDAAGLRLDRLAGVSIGSINAALIAGNPPERRVTRLREFWDGVANDPAPGMSFFWGGPPARGPLREGYNAAGVMQTLLLGRSGLFRPRPVPSGDGRTGLYDLAPLLPRLERLVDFARLNDGTVALRIAATDVLSGERVVFEAGAGSGIGPEHVLASCAQLPVYAPVEVGGRLLGDGCYSGNAPVDLVLDAPAEELLCFVVDLFDPRGSRPGTLAAAGTRAMDMMFGNQTRLRLDAAVREGALRVALDAVLERLPKEGRDDPALAPLLAALPPAGGARAASVFLLGYRGGLDEAGLAKGFDYTAATLSDRWEGGAAHACAALRALDTLPAGSWPPGVAVRKVPSPVEADDAFAH